MAFPRDPLSTRSARMFVNDTMAAWDATADMEALGLVTSEVVANALVHGLGEVSVNMTLEAGTLCIEVTDGSPELPVVRSLAEDSTSGRGMNIVEAFSERWGVEILSDGGKVVWFTVPATSRP